MKTLIFFVLTLLISGCATPSLFGPSQAELDGRHDQVVAIARQEESDRKALETAKDLKEAALKEGTPREQFEAAFGKPNRTELKNKVIYAHYAFDSDFTVYEFEDEKLIGWTEDSSAKTDYQVAQMKSAQQAAEIRTQQSQAEIDRKSRIRKAFSSFGNGVAGKKTINCESEDDGYGHTTTNCNN